MFDRDYKRLPGLGGSRMSSDGGECCGTKKVQSETRGLRGDRKKEETEGYSSLVLFRFSRLATKAKRETSENSRS